MSAQAFSSYLMENPDEAQRLEAKTERHVSERLLRASGLLRGMRALDAGAGTGAVARVMGAIVGSSGSVIAADRSEGRLEHGRALASADGITNLSFRSMDIEREALPESLQADFTWCRFVFEYLREPDLALANLVGSTRPGGKVVVADLDGNGIFHHPVSEDVEAGIRKVVRALEGHFDPFAGRKLFSRFRRAGLEDIRVHAEPYHLYPGVAPPGAIANWSEKLRVIRPRAVQAFPDEGSYDRWAEAFMSALRDEDVFTYSVLIVVEGRRPA